MRTSTPTPGPQPLTPPCTYACEVMPSQLVLAGFSYHDRAVVIQGTQSVDGKVTITEHTATSAGFSATMSLQLELFALAYQAFSGTRLDVYFASRHFETLFTPFAAAFPSASVHVACPPDMASLYRAVDRARSSAFDRMKAEAKACLSAQVTKPRPAPLVLGTDASVRRGHRGAGIACVSEDGRHAVRYLPGTSDILVAELKAIELALATHPHRDLNVRSDSQNAVAAVHRVAAGLASNCNETAARTVTRILAKAAGRQLVLLWTRGHCGDPLNEAADRLARMARRSQLRVPMSSLELIASGITSDLAIQLST
jgi:ribonuclease HI